MADEYAFLRDGRQVLIRPLDPSDRPAIADLFQRLSPESRALRFHSAGVRVSPATIDLATSGYALVAALDGRIAGLATYHPLREPGRAEMAIAVDDAQQGRGIGTVLFEVLSRDARQAGIRRLLALVLPSNRAMLGLLQGLGFQMRRRFAGGEIEVEVELRPDPSYVDRADARRHVAAAASLEPVFRPRAVAIIGASRQAGSIGWRIFRNVLAGGFAGAVYPVNPAASAVASVRAYPSIGLIPEPVDLAVLVVPAGAVLDAAREALDAGVHALVVVSAGFAERGEDGRRRQDELLHLCRSRGARLVGPNCMGVLVNSVDSVMNATMTPILPPPGPVAISAQSGTLGVAILERARQRRLGISALASLGNKADVSSNDLLEWWEDDLATGVILLYLESFGNPRRFARIARRVAARKPIIALTGGRGAPGQRTALSHTSALAGRDVAIDALFQQAGVIRCGTLEEMLDVALLLARQPLPAGNRVGILTNVGGLGLLCADACLANGLHLPELSAPVQEALRSLLPVEAAVSNPVDLTAAGSALSYGAVLRHILSDPAIDAAIALVIPPLATDADGIVAALAAAHAQAPAKPVLACVVGAPDATTAPRDAALLPSYAFPESAARALGHAAARAAWLRRPAGRAPTLAGIDAQAARAVVERALAREERPWLRPQDVHAVLRAYGVTLPDEIVVRTPEAAAEACRRLGPPIAIKVISRRVLHKSDVSGVKLDITSPREAAAAYREIAAAQEERGLAASMDGAIVQPMVAGGVECLVGVVNDPVFGPLIAFGLGGVLAETIGDVAFRVHPLTDVDADELIGSVKAAALLRGERGRPAADIAALREFLLRVSSLVDDVPELAELDINPVMVRPVGQGALALDARLRLGRLSG